MKKGFWRSDWFVGLAISMLFLVFSKGTLFEKIELGAYDFGVRSASRPISDKVAIIAIDDESLANIGRWPWPRDIHAKLIDLLAQGGPEVIGHTVLFIEPQIDPDLDHLNSLKEEFDQSLVVTNLTAEIGTLNSFLANLNRQTGEIKPPAVKDSLAALNDFYQKSSLADGRMIEDVEAIKAALLVASKSLDKDMILSESIARAGNVVLALPMILGNPRGNPNGELPDYILKNSLSNMVDQVDALEQGWLPLSTVKLLPPIAELGEKAAAIGHLNVIPNDADGAVRTEPLAMLYYDNYFPSLALQVVSRYLNLNQDEVKLFLGEKIQLGRLSIDTNEQLLMNTFFYENKNGASPFGVDSFYDVLNEKVPVSKYQDKIVLIGATAAGIGDNQVTPIGNMAPVLTLAHTVSSILNEDFYVSPLWGIWVTYGAFLIITLYLTLLFPRLKAGVAAVITAALIIGLLVTEQALLNMQALWLRLTFPATFLFIGHFLMTTKHFLVTEKDKEKVEAQSAESNRMLALQYQEKGQLDMAFEAFRKVEMDKQLMDSLYSLALDYERKRFFNKAGFVYQYLAEFDRNFRDIKDRLEMTKVAEGTVMLQKGSNAATIMATMAMKSPIEKPMLGRYSVEEELGKGAMGVVYLGKDPKINRVVAIKTMALSDEFEESDLEEVKSRFFREAESAGRLNHPNIVTIFDAGEEHDLAYIAMEFLKGGDMDPYTKPESLLPMTTVLDLMAQAANALSYAHENNVVHRDIKPANIMYDPDHNELKITDFGVARITDANKTRTGVVLGTPSYMSPEQVTGDKVDGRSDLFSLGIVLYKLLTGELPFKADSITTMMYMIASEKHADIAELQADIPPCVKQIIDKALKKDKFKRYQHGTEMASDLQECRKQL